MLTEKEYHMLGMTQYMVREFKDYLNQRERDEESRLEESILYPALDYEAGSYPVFTNPACGAQTAEEPLSNEFTKEHCRRWFFFFTPDPAKLPHPGHLQQLQKHELKLKATFYDRTSPSTLVWILCMLLSLPFLVNDRPMLASIPLIFAFAFWFKNQPNVNKAKQKISAHDAEVSGMRKQQDSIHSQLAYLPRIASLDELQERYQSRLEQLLHETLLERLRPHEIGDIHSVLARRNWRGFISESWGYLQTPLKTQENTEINRLLLNEQNITLTALQDIPQENEGGNIYRIQYLHIWILTDQGLLMGRAWYDRVTDRFLFKENEYYPYSQLTHIRVTEQLLPEQATLKEWLQEKVYRRFFLQPLMTISVGTTLGKTYECALPPTNEQRTYQIEWLNQYGLDSNLSSLNQHLLKHLYRS